jgi:beta-N-acetylhexosaminidase
MIWGSCRSRIWIPGRSPMCILEMTAGNRFLDQLRKYTRVDHVKATRLDEMISKLREYNLVIIGYHKSNASPWARYKFSRDELTWIHEIARNNLSVLKCIYPAIRIAGFKFLQFNGRNNYGISKQSCSSGKNSADPFWSSGSQGKTTGKRRGGIPCRNRFYTRAVNRLSYGIPESVGLRVYRPCQD